MFTSKTAFSHFTAATETFHRMSLQLAVSAAVCFIIGEAETMSAADVTGRLKESIGDTGLARSSVFRYIQLGQKLVLKLWKDYPGTETGAPAGSPIALALDAKTPGAAAKVIIDVLETADVRNADQLDVFLGAVPRSQRASATPTVRHASPEAVVATVADAEPGKADEIMGELLQAVTDIEALHRWRDMIDERIADLEKPRGRSKRREAVQHDGQPAN